MTIRLQLTYLSNYKDIFVLPNVLLDFGTDFLLTEMVLRNELTGPRTFDLRKASNTSDCCQPRLHPDLLLDPIIFVRTILSLLSNQSYTRLQPKLHNTFDVEHALNHCAGEIAAKRPSGTFPAAGA